jgi:hypothetical protein
MEKIRGSLGEGIFSTMLFRLKEAGSFVNDYLVDKKNDFR